jgi:hypothetical protein
VIPVTIRATVTASKSFKKYLSNILRNTKSRNYRKAMLGTAYILRKVLL